MIRKLTAMQCAEILHRWQERTPDLNMAKLARAYGVTRSRIEQIINGRVPRSNLRIIHRAQAFARLDALEPPTIDVAPTRLAARAQCSIAVVRDWLARQNSDPTGRSTPTSSV